MAISSERRRSYSASEWRSYYNPSNVADFFASYQAMIVAQAKLAQANGATVVLPKQEIGQGMGWISAFMDPENNIIGLHEMGPAAPRPAAAKQAPAKRAVAKKPAKKPAKKAAKKAVKRPVKKTVRKVGKKATKKRR